MASASPVHDFMLPRLTALVDEAVATGIARDVAVAVLIDLVTSPAFDTAAVDPSADSAPHTLWERTAESLVLIGDMPAKGPQAADAHDEADFVKPISPFLT
ncbi:MAG TPA: hypothetical protein DDZ81_24200 [Acetobacteraceae bacterium]|jgi:hypothetical protein|nr:hypothetical protein [Acetobacteraceae bacterium]